MNIIVPKSKEIDHVVLDFRDALKGDQMVYDPTSRKDLSNWVVVVPKTILKDSEDGFTLNKYVYIKKKFKQLYDDNHLQNLLKSLKLGVKLIELPKDKKSITVSAPLWEHSEQ